MNTTKGLPQEKDWDQFWTAGGEVKLSWSKKRILAILRGCTLPGISVLDAGCGSGFFSAWFARQGAHVTALDYSQSALDMAAKATGGKARLLKADLLQEELSQKVTDRFGIIFSDGLFEHFSKTDQDRIMRNLRSLLTEDGVIITFVPNRWSPWELIRPFFMPGIKETPFVGKTLLDLHERNGLKVKRSGGVNTLPFALSFEGGVASVFGMLLYTVASKKSVTTLP